MSLPPPPDSFFEGGEPQSEIAPGDTGRELVHEIRNLQQSVLLLKKIIVPRHEVNRRRRNAIVIGVMAFLVLLGLIGYIRLVTVKQSQDRLVSAHASCQRDYARGLVEIDILEASARGNPNPRAQAFFAPRIAKFKALQKDCDALYPLEGHKGWPTFWQVP